MENLFTKLLDEWLWQDKKTFHPFDEIMKEGFRGNREVPMPEISQDEKEFRVEQDLAAIAEENGFCGKPENHNNGETEGCAECAIARFNL